MVVAESKKKNVCVYVCVCVWGGGGGRGLGVSGWMGQRSGNSGVSLKCLEVHRRKET